jgi:hypothetical protein
MANALRTVVLLALLTLLSAAQDANAYPAVTVDCWKGGNQAATCQSSPTAAANQQALLQWPPQSGWYNHNVTGCTGTGNTRSCNVYVCQNPSCTINYTFAVQVVNTPTLQCPSGGTLTGSQCVCTAPQIDTGSSCTSPPACPAGQYDPPGPPQECVPMCGLPGSAVPEHDAGQGFTYPSGAKTFCTETTVQDDVAGPVSDHCIAEPSGSIIVCGDYGGGVSCFSEHARFTGARCAAAVDTTMPEDPTVCAEGDVWCKANSSGTCGAGFAAGTFSGQTICVKKGETVSVVPQPKSSTAPPITDHVTNPPTQSNPGTRDGETNDPNVRTVIGVGSGAMGGGDGGGGGGGGEDTITCGLPDTPACKIDEEGTPTGADADTAAKEGINAEAGKLDSKLAEIVAGTGAPDRTWGFNINFPTTCVPLVITTRIWGTHVLNFCQWQPVVHDIMSLVWISTTLFLCIGMVFRAVTGSPA